MEQNTDFNVNTLIKELHKYPNIKQCRISLSPFQVSLSNINKSKLQLMSASSPSFIDTLNGKAFLVEANLKESEIIGIINLLKNFYYLNKFICDTKDKRYSVDYVYEEMKEIV